MFILFPPRIFCGLKESVKCNGESCVFIFRKFSTEHSVSETNEREDDFRVLELFPMKKEKAGGKFAAKRFQDAHVLPSREKRMKATQHWPSVWPMPRTFHPASVPLPVYQGYDQKRAPPSKFANAELMKIPNFLHLTPFAIKRHCEAIKQFCTEFPTALQTDKDCMSNFPVEIITMDYCHSSPTIRDERSRIVTMKLKLSSLKLNYHGRDKLIRLVRPERYDKRTGMLTITADRCPLRKQNRDYLEYLLTAIHHESWVTEPWEWEKTEADMEQFFFKGSRIEKHVHETFAKVKSSVSSEKVISEEDVKDSEEITQYGKSVAAVINKGENEKNILNYKDAVLRVLNLKANKAVHDT